MARFEMVVPNDLLKEFQSVYDDTDKIFGGMTKAGAETVLANVKTNIPRGFANSDIMNCLKITKIYKTPSDDGINTKVMFKGYFINENGQREASELVANVFEYGSSKFTKQPFFRKSFNKAQIQSAMMKAQKELSGGLLGE